MEEYTAEELIEARYAVIRKSFQIFTADSKNLSRVLNAALDLLESCLKPTTPLDQNKELVYNAILYLTFIQDNHSDFFELKHHA